MARYVVGSEFMTIPITTGTVQNIDAMDSVEVTDDKTSGGMILYPGNKLVFSDLTLYVRSAKSGHEPSIAVVSFPK